jgi:hypothetical protein
MDDPALTARCHNPPDGFGQPYNPGSKVRRPSADQRTLLAVLKIAVFTLGSVCGCGLLPAITITPAINFCSWPRDRMHHQTSGRSSVTPPH